MNWNAIASVAIIGIIALATAILLAIPPVELGCPMEPTGRVTPMVVGKVVIMMPEYKCSDTAENR